MRYLWFLLFLLLLLVAVGAGSKARLFFGCREPPKKGALFLFSLSRDPHPHRFDLLETLRKKLVGQGGTIQIITL